MRVALHLAYLDVHLKVGNLSFCAVDQLITKKVIFLFNLVFFLLPANSTEKAETKRISSEDSLTTEWNW